MTIQYEGNMTNTCTFSDGSQVVLTDYQLEELNNDKSYVVSELGYRLNSIMSGIAVELQALEALQEALVNGELDYE